MSFVAKVFGKYGSNENPTSVPPTSPSLVYDAQPEKKTELSRPTSPVGSGKFEGFEGGAAEKNSIEVGDLTLDEDAAGGMGRHLGVFSCTLLIVGRVIGTGIFSTPSSILGSVGSVGASLCLWALGFIISFFGLFIWLELGTMFPRSGGEKNYLEAAFPRPKHLMTMVFATQVILLGFSASNSIVFAENILVAAGHEAGRWTSRGIGLGVIAFAAFSHGIVPRFGLLVMNALGVVKIVILVFVAVSGWAVLAGHTKVTDPHINFRNAFAGSSHSSNDYATALFKILFAYAGWTNLNYVLNNVKNPIRTLKIAGPLGLGICAFFYLFANIAYFGAASKEEILNSGVTVASLFFGKVFGPQAQKALTVFVALSALGNVLSVTFSCCRINQELAKEGLALPFGNRFWASNWPTKKSPFPGLILHLIPSAVIMIAPPPNVAYPFILDLEGYPIQIINTLVVFALFWLRWKRPDVTRPFKVFLPFAFVFLASCVFLLVAPFIRPANGVGDTPPIPYYMYAVTGWALMAFAVWYWAMWKKILPWGFRYKLVPVKETLSDGTVLIVYEHKKLN
ncbi:uncharacterized protein PHACADRAFT_192839 [Phanerochaete carnosa HHB-10118-sp]|uniref:Amino acid permease/ SLC12A domain-containing protein n=1 Tax=Phanerochaete carnosa (strain HHB-10118-sp) TaxID=650164 RepID=K5X4E3_PHACS|nr:uncharacterized protein PHACADRAFT_192839 [Phanerochaete carnosa HHB-10118-sp]EKM57702.1 hypothetical protein PHACADRAFT_192839 [Phanerochaete carnosa HHB-10118-sp]